MAKAEDPPKTERAARDAKLAQALRANLRRRKAGTGFYSHFGKRVEACSSEARGLDDGIIFFNGWPLVRNAGEAARQRRDRDTSSRAC